MGWSTHRAVRGGAAGAVALLVAALAGCSTSSTAGGAAASGSDASVSPGIAIVTGAALLDRDAATITWPLDQYEMADRGKQLVMAAQSVIMAQCLTGSSALPAMTAQQVRSYLQTAPEVERWQLGYWDATYIAQHGLGFGSSGGLPELAPGASKDQTEACYQQVEDAGLDANLGADSADGYDVASRGMSQAMDQALEDPAFKAGAAQKNACIAKAGYPADPDNPFGGVFADPSWSQEQLTKATVADANCADQLGFMQQAADIVAAYQQRYLDAHEAELVALSQEATNRVAKATQVLQDAGVM